MVSLSVQCPLGTYFSHALSLLVISCVSDLGQDELHLICGDAASLVLAEHAERLLEALLTNQR